MSLQRTVAVRELQCVVAACCSVLQCVAVCCSVERMGYPLNSCMCVLVMAAGVAVWCYSVVVHCVVAVRCIVLQRVAVLREWGIHLSSCMCVLLIATGVVLVAVWFCSTLQCVAACCSVEGIGNLFEQLYAHTVDSYRCCSV